MSIRDDKQCQTCTFYGLCEKANLDHCNGEDYYPEVKEENANG